MPTIDGVKMACQQCITGHRTSRCNHSHRDLIEIKKKGRPFSQCADCSNLRKNSAVHGRCDCEKSSKPSNKKTRVSPPISTHAESAGIGFQKDGRDREGIGPIASSSKLPKAKSSCCGSARPAPTVAGSSILTPSPLAVNPLPSIDAVSFQNNPLPSYPYANIPRLGAIPRLLTQEISKQGSSALFLPASTVGTHACFCGESCSCVGCAQHDPLGKKARKLTSGELQHGRMEGGGCGCGTTECVGLDVGINELLRSLTGAQKADYAGETNGIDIQAVQVGGYDEPIEDPTYRLPPILDENFYNYNHSSSHISLQPSALSTPVYISPASPAYPPLPAFGKVEQSFCCAETFHDEYSIKEECCEIVCDCTTACSCSSRLQRVVE